MAKTQILALHIASSLPILTPILSLYPSFFLFLFFYFLYFFSWPGGPTPTALDAPLLESSLSLICLYHFLSVEERLSTWSHMNKRSLLLDAVRHHSFVAKEASKLALDLISRIRLHSTVKSNRIIVARASVEVLTYTLDLIRPRSCQALNPSKSSKSYTADPTMHSPGFLLLSPSRSIALCVSHLLSLKFANNLPLLTKRRQRGSRRYN